MVTATEKVESMEVGSNLLDRFNSFFEGSARAEINNHRIEVTIGSQTLLISLPEVIGCDSMGQSQQS